MEGFDFDNFVGLDPESHWFPGTSTPIFGVISQDSEPPSTATRQRPRNPRSCDYCRRRKTACRIDSGPPCAACTTLGINCEFTERPRKRRRPGESQVRREETEHVYHLLREPRKSISSRSDSSLDEVYQSRAARIEGQTSLDATAQAEAGRGVNDTYRTALNVTGPPGASGQVEPTDLSIDSRPTETAFLLGDTGESDPYLLKHASLAASIPDQNPASKINYSRIITSIDSDQDRPLVFSFENHRLHDKYEPRVNSEVLQQAHTDLESTCNNEVGVRLVKLYFKYVYPYFPVLSRSQVLFSDSLPAVVQSLPLSLKAGLYATSLPFMVYDDVLSTTLDSATPSAHRLYRICWLAITQEIHSPHLSTLQSCLLLLQRVNDDKYVMDSPFRWSLLAWTVGLAQSLGLSTDCSDWQGLPPWEKRLRRRLWWATYVMDKWSFMSAGLSSHIKNEDFDVLPLTSADFVSGNEEARMDLMHEESHFYHLVELSRILSDIIDSYFSIRASKKTSTNFGLTLELAKPLRSRLHSWKESCNKFISGGQSDTRPQARLDGNASLGLAYPVATMILFRALLRPLDASGGTPEDKLVRESGRDAVRVGAKACCVEVVQYIESVKRGVWDAFWHSWSRAGFAIVSSFMMRLLITSTSDLETAELNSLIERWRWAMRTGGGSAGNVLMSLGLLRLDRSLLKSGIREAEKDS